jgi:hypothetical protein
MRYCFKDKKKSAIFLGLLLSGYMTFAYCVGKEDGLGLNKQYPGQKPPGVKAVNYLPPV